MSTSENFARVKDLEVAASKSKEKYTELSDNIGTLSSLTTTDNSSIVAAINEVISNGGGGGSSPINYTDIDCGEFSNSNSNDTTTGASSKIKSLLHCENNNLLDELGRVTWKFADNTEQTDNGEGSIAAGNQKFGQRCVYFHTSADIIRGVNKKGLFKIDMDYLQEHNCLREFEFFVYINSTNKTSSLVPGEDISIISFVEHTADSQHWFDLTLDKTDLSFSNTGNFRQNGSPLFEFNKWQHVLIRFSNDGNWVYCYVDGNCMGYGRLNYVPFNIDTIDLGGFIGNLDEFAYREVQLAEDDNNAYDETVTVTVPTSPYDVTPEYEPDGEVLKLDGAIQLRGDTAAALRTLNPILARREIMVEVDTGKLKVGNGTTRWNSLGYVGAGL